MSFQQGEYNLKESVYTPYGQNIRTYMSGGLSAEYIDISGLGVKTERASNPAEQRFLEDVQGKNAVVFDHNFKIVNPDQPLSLAASPVEKEEVKAAIAKVRDEGFAHLKEIGKEAGGLNPELFKNEEYGWEKEEWSLSNSKLFNDGWSMIHVILDILGALSVNYDLLSKDIEEGKGLISSLLEQKKNDEAAKEEEINVVLEKEFEIIKGMIREFEKIKKEYLPYFPLLTIAEIKAKIKKAAMEHNGENHIEDIDKLGDSPEAIINWLRKELKTIDDNQNLGFLDIEIFKDTILTYQYLIVELKEHVSFGSALTDEGHIINVEVLEKISGRKKIIKLFSADGEELIKRYPDSKGQNIFLNSIGNYI